MKLIKLSLWAKKNGYSYRGAYNRFHAGRIEGAFKNETGRIIVPVEEVFTEIASGLNDKRPKLEKILKVKTPIRLVVEHKDRLTRFCFHYIET